jgi:hypothetical protein
MKNSFTLNDLLFFNYNETEEGKEHGFSAINLPVLNEYYYLNTPLTTGKKWLFSPDEKIVKNIMNYSRALIVLKTEKTGSFNFLMN